MSNWTTYICGKGEEIKITNDPNQVNKRKKDKCEESPQIPPQQNFYKFWRISEATVSCWKVRDKLEAAIGIEPMNKAFAEINNYRSYKSREAQAVTP